MVLAHRRIARGYMPFFATAYRELARDWGIIREVPRRRRGRPPDAFIRSEARRILEECDFIGRGGTQLVLGLAGYRQTQQEKR